MLGGYGRTHRFIYIDKTVSEKSLEVAFSHQFMYRFPTKSNRGFVRNTTAMPLQIRDKRDTKAFLKEAQKTSRRRNDLSWKSFDEFKKDLGQVYFSEDQNYTDMWGGKKLILLACSCIDGVKGRMCDHVLALPCIMRRRS